MGFFNLFNSSPEADAARQEGFQIAESYFRKAVQNFYRDVRRGLIKDMASLSTATTHRCNCEFCWTNEPQKV